MNYKDITVIIPTLNEEKNISDIIGLINDLYKDITIIVADDGSKDNTQKIVKKINGVILLDRSKEKIKGLTASVINAAKLAKTDCIIVIDADMQHPPEKIKEIIENLRAGYDLVIAARERKMDWSLSRKIISKTATHLGRMRLLLHGKMIIDPMSGFFGIKTELFKKILNKKENKFEKTGYKVLFDILKYSGNAKINEVFYKFQQRKQGSSKIGKKQIMVYLRSLFK